MLTSYQSQYVAWELTRRAAGDSMESLASTLVDAQVGVEQLTALAEEVGEGRSLLVCCSAFRGITAAQASQRWPQLTVKKLPKMVLSRCEWGHDDYSLNVANLPMAEKPPAEPKQAGLFGDGGEEEGSNRA